MSITIPHPETEAPTEVFMAHAPIEGYYDAIIRADQLAFWLIAAQGAIQADLETRIAALEGAA